MLNMTLQEVYKEYKPADITFLANTQIILEVVKDNPESASTAIYEMWTAIKEHVEGARNDQPNG